MRRSNATLLVLLAIAAVGALLLVVDPLGILGGSGSGDSSTPAATLPAKTAPEPEVTRPDLRGAELTHVKGEPIGTLDLRLGDGVLRGSVTGDGQPLRHARVEPLRPWKDEPILPAPLRGAVRTDDEGRYEIRGLPEGQFDLRASADGWRSRTEVAPKLLSGATLEVPPIALGHRLALTDGLEVRVTDLEGRPIAGAKVLATTLTWSVDTAIGADMAGMRDVVRKSALTSERGVARIEALPPDNYDVVASAAGRVTVAVPGVHVARGRVLPVTVRLGPGVSISGKVVDASGKPVADAYAFGLHQPTFTPCLSSRTAADGTFTLDGLREGTYMLIVGSESHGSSLQNRVPSPSAGHLIELKGAGKIDGYVTTADGKPVTSFEVRPAATQPFGYEYSRVWKFNDPAGHFQVALPEGPYEVRVRTPDGTLGTAKSQVTVGATSNVKVQIGASAVVRGVVTDPEGNHLESAEVFVNLGGMPGGPSREQYARTDPEGRFEVAGLGLEKVVLHARHARYADTKWEGRSFIPGTGSDVTIRMEAGASLKGRITRADGKGAAGEQVNLYQGWFEARTIFADDDGNYVYEHVAAGKWNLSTGPFEPGAGGLSKNGIEIGTSGTVVENLAYSEAQGVVTGVVLAGGRPLVGATIYVSDERGTGQSITVKTNEQGAFEAAGLATGRVQVYVESAEGLTTTRSVRLDPATNRADVRIEFGQGTVKGRCLGSDDVPVSGAWVNVERVDAASVQVATVASRSVTGDGVFDIRGVGAGNYRLRIWAGGYAQVTTEPFTLAEGETKDLGTVRVPRGGDLTGRVTDDTGRPVENATISLKDSGGRPVFTFSLFTTGSDGRYTVQGISPGRYTVGAEAAGLAPGRLEVDVAAEGAEAHLVLARGGALRVAVVDDAGKALEGARVSLTDALGQPVTRTLSLANFFESGRDRTGPEGEVLLPDLAAGAYRVKATLSGYVTSGEEPTVTASSGGTTGVRVVLTLESPTR